MAQYFMLHLLQATPFMLKEVFFDLLKNYTGDSALVTNFWQEIEKNYGNRSRHYHNLSHLEILYAELVACKDHIAQWEAVLFAVFYHDIVYNTFRQDNEEKSAELAAKRLASLNVPASIMEICGEMINATKGHYFSANADVNLFTDADLCILGKDWNTYANYFANIRKEYALYPDMMYRPGRKKVLQHYLGMKRIFKTEMFYRKYETVARENLTKELNGAVS
jgi:predicted metal-dependent HD superfamily phosphohydrolase